MKRISFVFVLIPGIILISCARQELKPREQVLLRDNWTIQSSSRVKAEGKIISTTDYHPEGWYPVSMPSTVLAALVKNKVFPDPYYGTNIESLPGYVKGRMHYIPENSPYRVPWWYRTEFTIPQSFRGKKIWLDFHSINYRANVWLNGRLVADTSAIEGAYRLYNLDITKYAVAGASNVLALEIYPPRKNDLTITWVDWNPTPPDMAMGIWYDVSLHATGTVNIQHPYIVTKLNLPATDTARLIITTELNNNGEKEITGTLTGNIENIVFSQKVTLAPGETRMITFSPKKYRQLVIANPRLWWPHTVGPQNLYDLNLKFEANGKVSDVLQQRFGIREITSYMNNFDNKHTKVFQINGKNIVIRGGGYVQDMLLRPSRKNMETAILYAKHMNLNALRMEAPRGSDALFDMCDENGILLMVGWCCCSTWEHWDVWTPHTADIAEASWKDQIIHLRNHPSVFTWLYGSDKFPPADIEKRYIAVLDKYDGTRPYESSATGDPSAIAGNTGVWMGPYPDVYAYEVPSYWYGKLEFNTEAAPGGEQLPPIESMRKMMPKEDLWPVSRSWKLRLHKAFYPQARKALFSRYGKPAGPEEYCMKSQVFQKEATRAMFEAFAGNKYRSSGIIYWMYNSAWPSLYWQLYDYFLTPNGAFYGTKKACEPLHIQYSYGDSGIYVINGYYRDFHNLKASAQIYDLSMQEKYSGEVPVDISSDKSRKVLNIDWPENLSSVYFLKLQLRDDDNKLISSNFYWLSNKGDKKADFTALNSLPEVSLDVAILSSQKEGDHYTLAVTLENPSAYLAFDINPSVKKGQTGELVTPVFWEDNYFSLLPGEKRKVTVTFNAGDLDGRKPLLEVKGWNIKKITKDIE